MDLSIKQTTQLKAIAILFVILGHLKIINNAGTWGVSLFLILSGYGLVLSFNKNGLYNFFKKKISKILVPYSLITIIWIIIDTFIGIKYKILDVFTSILGINFEAVVDGTMWYIPYILIWYMVFYLIFKLVENKWIRLVALFTFSLILYIVANKIFDANVGSSFYVFQFPIGVLLGELKEYENNVNLKVINLIVLLISIGTFIISFNKVDKLIFNFICFNSVSFILLALSYLIKVTVKPLETLGKIAYELYLIEGVFMWKYDFIFTNINNTIIAIAVYFMFILILATIINKLMSIEILRFKQKQVLKG